MTLSVCLRVCVIWVAVEGLRKDNTYYISRPSCLPRLPFHPALATAVRRHCTDWYEIWALTDHEIYYIKIELDLRKFSNGPFSETEKGFWVNPMPGGSQCTEVSPTPSWKWPRATLSPSFGPFFERNHSFGVKMVSENFWKTFKSCPWSWYPTGKKQIYIPSKRSFISWPHL